MPSKKREAVHIRNKQNFDNFSLTFKEWMGYVDEIIKRETKYHYDEFPDEDYWTYWDSGITYYFMADFVMVRNGYRDFNRFLN